MLMLNRVEQEKEIRSIPPSDLPLFTTSALQTANRRYLGNPAPHFHTADQEYDSESTAFDCGCLPPPITPPHYADLNRNTDPPLHQPSAKLAPLNQETLSNLCTSQVTGWHHYSLDTLTILCTSKVVSQRHMAMEERKFSNTVVVTASKDAVMLGPAGRGSRFLKVERY